MYGYEKINATFCAEWRQMTASVRSAATVRYCRDQMIHFHLAGSFYETHQKNGCAAASRWLGSRQLKKIIYFDLIFQMQWLYILDLFTILATSCHEANFLSLFL